MYLILRIFCSKINRKSAIEKRPGEMRGGGVFAIISLISIGLYGAAWAFSGIADCSGANEIGIILGTGGRIL